MKNTTPVAQNPLILKFHRLLEAFAKSDDERDFYFDRVEGFLLFADLDKSEEDLANLEKELTSSKERYCLIPKMTFYETKKFMEGFVNEKVYDIDTKEKLLDIIHSKDARENFVEFIYDNLTELEKWQAYYQERSRIRIIEWLRNQEIRFVFEEDLDLATPAVEKLKRYLFDENIPKDVMTSRNAVVAKSKTYYSNEALNPRPKRGRPPKQVAKVEVEPQLTVDVYVTIPALIRLFLFIPEYSAGPVTFSAKFDTEAQLIASLRGSSRMKIDPKLEGLSRRLESLSQLSDRLKGAKGLGGEDEKLVRAVSERRVSTKEDETVDKKQGKVSAVAKGFMPGKTTEKMEMQKMIKEKKKAGIKRVAQIKGKKT